MRVIYNDIDEHFHGGIKVINVQASKRVYAEVLKCPWVEKSDISIAGRRFRLIQPAQEKSHRWSYISGINVMSAPELVGSFLVTGIDRRGRNRSLTNDETKFLTHTAFVKDCDSNGRTRCMLCGIE